MVRDKFMFFSNFKITADKLDNATRLEFYDAITNYVFNNIEPDNPIISALLEAIKPSLDKVDSRKNNGGNHNPNGVNQHTKNNELGQSRSILVNSGQNRSILVNSGQSSSKTEIEVKKEPEKTDKIELQKNFDVFWETYTPVKTNAGAVVAKGSKKLSFEKYARIIKSGTKPEDILQGLKNYIAFCQKHNQLTCGVPVFLNQERWKDEYNVTTIIGQQQVPRMSFKEMKELQNHANLEKLLKGEV